MPDSAEIIRRLHERRAAVARLGASSPASIGAAAPGDHRLGSDVGLLAKNVLKPQLRDRLSNEAASVL